LVAGLAQATSALWKPFEAEFGKIQAELKRQSEEVKEEIFLESQQAAHKERRLQMMEREVASRHRRAGAIFRRRTELDSEEARNWRLQINERQSSEFRLSNEVPLC
jgi:hypothetical protein